MSSKSSSARTRAADAATGYAESVASGATLAGPLVRLAAARHLRDLATAGARGLRWRPDLAARPIRFIERVLRLPDSGEPFRLLPWQKFVIGSLYGWTMANDGTRRFRSAFIETGKSSGKTPLAAALLLYSMLEDGERSSECYSAAPSRDQSLLAFRDASRMVQASPGLRQRVEVLEQALYHPQSGSVVRPLSSEARTLDGRRVHFAVLDELQEHADRNTVDKMRMSTKARRQPLIVELLNAGWDRHSVAWEHHEHTREILDGTRENEEWFGFIASLDLADDWHDERVWPKPNPSLPQLPGLRYLREQVREAEGMPARESIVLRLNFGHWTEAGTPWLNMEQVRACATPGLDLADFAGRAGVIGIDLGTTESITVVALLFRDETTTSVFVHGFLPGDHVLALAARDKLPYDVWVREGHLTVTQGPIVDLEAVREHVRGLAARVSIQALAYDDWGATAFAQQLEADGLVAVKIDQSPKGLAAACRELERLLAEGRLRVAPSPLFETHCANAVARLSRAGAEFMMPAKASDTQRIDALSAVLTALAGALLTPPAFVSIYDERARRGEPVLVVI
jgi:phage terminase large subunit-like protein